MTYLLTYDHAHRKTQDLIFHLVASDIRFELVLLPWLERKNYVPLYTIRPESFKYSPRDLASRFNLSVWEDLDSVPEGARCLIGGAGILPEEFVKNHEVINAHPGRIPRIRGLDAVKWSIYYGDVIGVTLHKAGIEADMGFIIRFAPIKLWPTDSIHSIGQRVYEKEIELLTQAAGATLLEGSPPAEPAYNPNRRMPKHKEIQMVVRLHDRLMKQNDWE